MLPFNKRIEETHETGKAKSDCYQQRSIKKAGKKCKFSPLNHIDHNFKPQESYFMGNINDQLKEMNDKMEQHRESVISLAFLELESKVNLVTSPSEMLFNRNRESTLPVNINSSTLSKSFVQITQTNGKNTIFLFTVFTINLQLNPFLMRVYHFHGFKPDHHKWPSCKAITIIRN
uniref:Uncharacterized protein n=1 Tax=Tetranychus urticae TaxID=32264 RepID=T1KNN0_TETUR